MVLRGSRGNPSTEDGCWSSTSSSTHPPNPNLNHNRNPPNLPPRGPMVQNVTYGFLGPTSHTVDQADVITKQTYGFLGPVPASHIVDHGSSGVRAKHHHNSLCTAETCKDKHTLSKSVSSASLLRYPNRRAMAAIAPPRRDVTSSPSPSVSGSETVHQNSTVSLELIRRPNSGRGFGFSVTWSRPPRIEKVEQGSPAEKAGVHVGDYIISIGDQNVMHSSESEVMDLIMRSLVRLPLKVYRKNLTVHERQVTPVLQRPGSSNGYATVPRYNSNNNNILFDSNLVPNFNYHYPSECPSRPSIINECHYPSDCPSRPQSNNPNQIVYYPNSQHRSAYTNNPSHHLVSLPDRRATNVVVASKKRLNQMATASVPTNHRQVFVQRLASVV